MILFQPEGLTYINKAGETVLEAARTAGLWLESPCGGNGTCGKCKVKVLVGEFNEVSQEEKDFFSQEELDEGWRLACKLVPKQYYRSVEIERDLKDDKGNITKPEMSTFYTDRQEELQPWQNEMDTIFQKDEKCSLFFGKKEVTVSENGFDGDVKESYGISVDIGTTNMEALLWNMKLKKCVARVIAPNPQQTYGSDVVSRLTYASRGQKEFETLCDCLRNGITEMLKVLTGEKSEKVTTVSVVANGVMMHFLRRESIDGMTKAPFVSGCKDWKEEDGELFHLPKAKIILFPNIKGFVGADMLGVLLYLQKEEDLNRSLVLDIGTNGELAVVKDGSIYISSTAAGPAFEGASISCGMRGEEGAIQGVTIGKEISLDVIGKTKAKGICGSGLVSLVAELKKAGVILDTGYLMNGLEAKNAGCVKPILEGIKVGSHGNDFWCNENVVLTQQDIRELQLAKAAVITGCKLLLQKCGLKKDEISHMYLAGAFGKYLDLEAGKTIGLLPDILNERIKVIGNGALLGATMFLFDTDREKISNIIKKSQHISLADTEGFQELYMGAMNL